VKSGGDDCLVEEVFYGILEVGRLAKAVPSPEGDSRGALDVLGTAVPGFHVPSLRDWGVGSRVGGMGAAASEQQSLP